MAHKSISTHPAASEPRAAKSTVPGSATSELSAADGSGTDGRSAPKPGSVWREQAVQQRERMRREGLAKPVYEDRNAEVRHHLFFVACRCTKAAASSFRYHLPTPLLCRSPKSSTMLLVRLERCLSALAAAFVVTMQGSTGMSVQPVQACRSAIWSAMFLARGHERALRMQSWPSAPSASESSVCRRRSCRPTAEVSLSCEAEEGAGAARLLPAGPDCDCLLFVCVEVLLVAAIRGMRC